MRKTCFLAVLSLGATSALAADYLPFNHRGPGFGACRSFISTPGKGQIPYWSEVFPTTASGYDLLVPFEAFIKSNYGNIGQIFSGTCFKTATAADAEELRNDPMYVRDAVSTGWRPSGSMSAASDTGERKGAQSQTSKKTSAPRPAEQAAKHSSEGNGPTPNQLKYQRELEAYNRRLEEIEAIKKQAAAQKAANQAAAKQVLAQHDQDMARHQQEVAAADAAKRRYEQELADRQRLVEQMRTKDEKNRLVEWREAVVVCQLDSNDPQSKFGNWRCDGPLQFTYAKLGANAGAPSPQALTALSEACGGSREAIRDLGMVSGARLFGCSFGLHPNATSGFHVDAAAKHGIAYVPGRAIYHCPASQSYCRTK